MVRHPAVHVYCGRTPLRSACALRRRDTPQRMCYAAVRHPVVYVFGSSAPPTHCCVYYCATQQCCVHHPTVLCTPPNSAVYATQQCCVSYPTVLCMPPNSALYAAQQCCVHHLTMLCVLRQYATPCFVCIAVSRPVLHIPWQYAAPCCVPTAAAWQPLPHHMFCVPTRKAHAPPPPLLPAAGAGRAGRVHA